jgi:hypothetical protein
MKLKVPRHRPFVLLIGKACGWKSVLDIGGIIEAGETEVFAGKHFPLPLCSTILYMD